LLGLKKSIFETSSKIPGPNLPFRTAISIFKAGKISWSVSNAFCIAFSTASLYRSCFSPLISMYAANDKLLT